MNGLNTVSFMAQDIIQDSPGTYTTEIDDMKIKLGIDGSRSFFPKLRVEKWDGDASLEMHSNLRIFRQPQISSDTRKVGWRCGSTSVELRHADKDRFAFDHILHRKPRSNILVYYLKARNLEFHYQPPLTEEQKISREIIGDLDVAGSFAVYHTHKMNGKYKTGKFCHIYRPKIIDANGAWTFGNLNIAPSRWSKDGEDYFLTVTVPQGFLDTATYPVTVDPDFGNTNSGGWLQSVGVDQIFAWKSSVDDMGGYGYGTHLYAAVELYDNVNPGTPDNFSAMNVYHDGASTKEVRLCETDVISHGDGPATKAWIEYDFSSSPRKPYFKGGNTEYYIAFYSFGDFSGKNYVAPFVGMDTTYVHHSKIKTKTWANPPNWTVDSWTSTSSAFRRISLYANYIQRRRRVH